MRVLVIGNGFDLDLGLPTRYKDFIHSEESDCLTRWKDMPAECLAFHLTKCSEGQWFDIEEAMAEYVEVREMNNDYSSVIKEIDECILKELKDGFWNYVANKLMDIGNNSWEKHVKDSMAKNIIEMQNRTKCFDKIYSFNCFDYFYCDLASNQELECLNYVNYIHGTGPDFILGIGEDDCKSDMLSFLKKTNQKGYQHEIISQFKSNLMKADEVFIFGHSLNRIDMMYFREMLWNIYLYQNKAKRITIITKNVNTAEQIKENISNHAPILFEKLCSSCQLIFLYTDKYINSKRIDNIEDLVNI